MLTYSDGELFFCPSRPGIGTWDIGIRPSQNSSISRGQIQWAARSELAWRSLAGWLNVGSRLHCGQNDLDTGKNAGKKLPADSGDQTSPSIRLVRFHPRSGPLGARRLLVNLNRGATAVRRYRCGSCFEFHRSAARPTLTAHRDNQTTHWIQRVRNRHEITVNVSSRAAFWFRWRLRARSLHL